MHPTRPGKHATLATETPPNATTLHPKMREAVHMRHPL